VRKKKKKKCSIHRLFGSYLSSILYCIFCIICVLFCKNLFIIWKLCFFLFADDDVLCPVKTFVHYKKKLNPKCVFLFQRPSKQTKVDVWYDNMPLGRNQLGSIMSEISKEFSFSQVYTNHSLRATTVHVLDPANIAGRHIMSVTGHKSESSLKTYTGYTRNKTKKTMSSIVSDSLSSSVPATNRTADVKREVEDLNNNNDTDLRDFQLNTNHLDLVPLTSS